MSRRPLTVEDLERWALSGAEWRIVSLSDTVAEVDLCECTGEVVERHESEDPEVIAYLRSAGPDRPG